VLIQLENSEKSPSLIIQGPVHDGNTSIRNIFTLKLLHTWIEY